MFFRQFRSPHCPHRSNCLTIIEFSFNFFSNSFGVLTVLTRLIVRTKDHYYSEDSEDSISEVSEDCKYSLRKLQNVCTTCRAVSLVRTVRTPKEVEKNLKLDLTIVRKLLL